MRNYLLRLGWGHGDTEIISTEDAVKIFTLEDIGRSPSRMDFTKLAHVNANYMRQLPDNEVMELLVPFVEKAAGHPLDRAAGLRIEKGLHDLKERAQTLIELANAAMIYVRPRPLALDEAAAKTLDTPTRQMLGEVRPLLENLKDFTAPAIESALKDFGTQKGLKLGKVAMPFRAALTGTTNSPSIFHVAEILGREEILGRLKDIILP
jgi:glutamyl-tRNA synthetase